MSESEPTISPQPLEYAPPAKREMRAYVRVGLTLFDQAIVSIATYLTTVWITRSTQEGAGLYLLVFTLWIVAGEAQNSLISTPQMLRLPRLSTGRARRFNGSLLVHSLGLSAFLIVLLLVASGIIKLVHLATGWTQVADFPIVLLLSAITVAPLALRNFARNYCFATRDAVNALTIDIVVCLVQLGGVGVLFFFGELHHWWLATLIVAIANLVAGLLWLSMSRHRFAPQRRRILIDLQRNWRTSRPIFASSMLWTAGMYAYPWMIVGIAGSAANGIWAACFTLANLGNPLAMGIQNFMGPAIAHAHADRDASAFRRYVLKCTLLYVLIVLPACVVMAVLAEPLLRLFNGSQYAGYGAVTAILAFTMLLQGLSFPTSRGLFSLGRASLDMLANLGPLVVLLVAGALLINWQGVIGAAICLVVAQGIGSALRCVAFLIVSKPDTKRLATLSPAEVTS